MKFIKLGFSGQETGPNKKKHYLPRYFYPPPNLSRFICQFPLRWSHDTLQYGYIYLNLFIMLNIKRSFHFTIFFTYLYNNFSHASFAWWRNSEKPNSRFFSGGFSKFCYYGSVVLWICNSCYDAEVRLKFIYSFSFIVVFINFPIEIH